MTTTKTPTMTMTTTTTTTAKLKLPRVGAVALLMLLCGACGISKPTGVTGSGGVSGTGGATTGAGGSTGSGGVGNGTGGSTGTGGGATATGGSTGTGGATATGGSTGTGGVTDAGIDGNDTPPGNPVNLRTAGNYVILAKSGISTVPTSAVTGNLGISPAAATYITEFSLIADSTNVFSTSTQVTGRVYASDYTPPTPSNLTTAVGDMMTAFTDAAGRAPGVTELGAGNIGGRTLPPNVYRWGTAVIIPSNVTLTGSATAVWIFQIAQDLTMSSATNVFLTGGALAKNVFWQVSGAVVLGTTAHLEGIVLSQTGIALRTGASVNGRLLAQTAVTIDGSTVVQPAP
jgi:hypothetical protein